MTAAQLLANIAANIQSLGTGSVTALKLRTVLNNFANSIATSVAGRTGDVTLSTADISGLGSLATQSGTFSGTSSGSNSGNNATNTTYASDYRAANFIAGTNYLAPNGSASSLTSFPTLNQSTSGNAGTATALATPRSISASGDGSWTVSFDGGANVTAAMTLANVAAAGTYRSVTVNVKGLVTSGTNPTTLSGYGITDAQPLDSDLTAIAALSTTSYGRALLALADAAAGQTALGLGTLATQSGTFSGTSSGTNSGDQSSVTGNAGTATVLASARSISATGDGSWTVSFDGGANVTAAFTLATVTFAKGGTNATTAAGAFDNLSVHGADIPSSATLNLEAATGNLVDVTGTTTVTAVTLSEGHERTVRFTGALILTHGSSLVLLGAANLTTAAGDFAVFRGYASGVVRCVLFSAASGVAAGVVTLTGTQTLTNKTISGSSNTLSNLTTAMFASAVIDTDVTLAAASDTRLATQKAVKTYVDSLLAAQDAMVFKGVLDCSASPNYPAAEAGHTYRVSGAGKIGGGSGTNVEAGDLLLCIVDSTASGTQAGVGANWNISQSNIDGAVTGPASAANGNAASFSGTSGKIIADSGKAFPSGLIVGTTDNQALTNKSVNGVTPSGSGTLANSGTSSLAGFTGSGSSSGTNTGDQTTVSGNAGTASALAAARTIAATGDIAWSVSFDGSGNVTAAAVLATVTTAKGGTGATTAYGGFDALSVHGADIPSSATLNLTAATGNLVDVTGTTTVTAITLTDGLERTVRFTGALTLTHGSSLVLPGSANITTAAGDFAIFRGYASGVVRCVSFSAASGVGAGLVTLTGTQALTNKSINGVTPSGSGTLANSGTSSLTGFTGSGVSSGTNSGDQSSVTGNAGTATVLSTARNINGVPFDGSANITIPAGTGDVTGPAVSVSGNLSTFSGTTGKVIQDSGLALAALATTASLANTKLSGISFIADGAGSALTTGLKGFIEIPYAGTITGWTLIGDLSGSIVVDLWKTNYTSAPPIVGNTITASTKPTLSSAQKNKSATLTGWTTAVAAGDVLAINIDSCVTVTRCMIALQINRS